jgi:hypothetical protein
MSTLKPFHLLWVVKHFCLMDGSELKFIQQENFYQPLFVGSEENVA